ncbi:MAG TPA: MCE family protein [Nocardioidaceae bacterium]|nr:MCE family protein [Nocardioidaceae bacterium]
MTARDPRKIATYGLLVVTLVVLLGLRAGDLPFLNPARVTYQAELLDAGGLRVGDPVEVAGVRVGQIDRIDVEGDRVVVDFAVDKGVWLGEDTEAAVKVGSLLGAKYLDLDPRGESVLTRHATIPLDRTTPAYDVVTAFADLANVEARLDTASIAEALDTLSSTLRDSPAEVRGALRGLSRFSESVSSRDAQIKDLLRHAASTSAVLDRRKGDVTQLVGAADLLLAELQRRKDVIHQLLVNTHSLAEELDGLVADSRSTLTPALEQLDGVTALLVRHERDLRKVIVNVNAYGQTFNNVIGSGPWFDVVIPRLPNRVDLVVAR